MRLRLSKEKTTLGDRIVGDYILTFAEPSKDFG